MTKVAKVKKQDKKAVTQVIFVVDRSGSMSNIAKDMIGGFEQFINTQKANKGGVLLISLYDFDTEYREVYSEKPIEDVGSLVLEPRGLTALYDALGKTINSVKIKHKDNKPDEVLVVVVTDGEENASTEYKSEQIKKLVEDVQKDDKWQFIYLGANHDAILAASKIGVAAGSSAGYSTTTLGVNNTWNYISTGVAMVSGCAGTSHRHIMSFSTEDRHLINQ